MKYWLIYCLIYVFIESPFKTVSGIRSLLKFTLNCRAHASLLPDQSHLQVYCQSHLQVSASYSILLYVRLMGCNSVAWIYGQLTGWRCNGVAWIYDRLIPCQFTINPCYTVTPSLPIDHRSMLHHYIFPLPIDHTSMQHCYTPWFSIVIIFNCQLATDHLHAVQMLIFYHHLFHEVFHMYYKKTFCEAKHEM